MIKEFKGEGPIAMVGDGINDAPALATSDIDISMGIAGSAFATETGHVILLSNDMRKIPKAIKLSRKATWKVRQNIFLSIITKVAIVALAIAGHPLVWAAVLADVGTCLLVILNSMLLLQETHKHGGKCCKSSSSSPHKHKHGRNDGHSHAAHKGEKCCSDKKAPKLCRSQKCSSLKKDSKCQANSLSSSSCCDDKCGNSAEPHDDCGNSYDLHEAQHCYHDLESQNTHCHHGSCPDLASQDTNNGTQTLSSSIECHPSESDGVHDAKKCHHSASSFVESKKSPNSCQSHSSCCGETLVNTEKSQKRKESNSVHQHSHQHQHQHPDIHPCRKKCDQDHITVGVMPGSKHVESENSAGCMNSEKRESGGCCKNLREEFPKSPTPHVCMSLEKREIGGCCKSYMKECCSNHGHLGAAAFGGGLSEVVID